MSDGPKNPGPSAKGRGGLRVVESAPERSALSAKWPDVVGELQDDDRNTRVRTGIDTVMLDDPSNPNNRRGFVKVVLRVPLHHDDGQVFGVFVEVDREDYVALKEAFKSKTPTRVWGKLANRLPLLEEAFGCDLCVFEDGSDNRARVVDARHPNILNGPEVGPWEESKCE